MRKLSKKLMALAMAGVMMCAPMTVFAAGTGLEQTGSASGSGSVEGWVDTDVINVVLPTDSDSTTFKFIMDPQELAANAGTTGGKYTDTIAEGATVLFKNTTPGASESDSDTYSYSATSDALKATNKSTFAVDLNLTAKVTGLSSEDDGYDIKMVNSSSFTGTDTSLYLGLITAEATTPLTADNAGVSVSTTIAAAKDGAYEAVYRDGVYKNAETSAATSKPEDYYTTTSFKLTGACNSNEGADWSKATGATPAVTVSWSLSKHADTPTAPTTLTYSKASGATLAVNLGSGETAASAVTVTQSSAIDGTYSALSITPTLEGNTLTFPAGAWSTQTAGTVKYLKLRFNDTAKLQYM